MFKHSKVFDYNIKGARSENCVLINSDNWVANNSNAIIGVDSRGGMANTCITEVLATNYSEDLVNRETVPVAGDTVWLTGVATRLYCPRSFKIPIGLDSTRYTDIPFAHIIGIFRHNLVSIATLHLLGNYVLLQRLKDVDKKDGLQITTNHTDSIYKVDKIGPNSAFTISGISYVLVRDNVTTPIMLDGEMYYAVSYKDILAGWADIRETEFSIDTVTHVFNNYIIMADEQNEFARDGGNIYKPNYDVDLDNEYLTELYDESRFKVIKSGNSDFPENTVVHAIREALEYCTLHGTTYYTTNTKRFIMCKITGD